MPCHRNNKPPPAICSGSPAVGMAGGGRGQYSWCPSLRPTRPVVYTVLICPKGPLTCALYLRAHVARMACSWPCCTVWYQLDGCTHGPSFVPPAVPVPLLFCAVEHTWAGSNWRGIFWRGSAAQTAPQLPLPVGSSPTSAAPRLEVGIAQIVAGPHGTTGAVALCGNWECFHMNEPPRPIRKAAHRPAGLQDAHLPGAEIITHSQGITHLPM